MKLLESDNRALELEKDKEDLLSQVQSLQEQVEKLRRQEKVKAQQYITFHVNFATREIKIEYLSEQVTHLENLLEKSQ